MPTASDGATFSNISATTAAFKLGGGKYNAAAIISAGTAKLQALGPDGATWLSIGAASDFAANGLATVDLAPGAYRFTLAGASGVSCSVYRVPS
jgi:hypothetical protein